LNKIFCLPVGVTLGSMCRMLDLSRTLLVAYMAQSIIRKF